MENMLERILYRINSRLKAIIWIAFGVILIVIGVAIIYYYIVNSETWRDALDAIIPSIFVTLIFIYPGILLIIDGKKELIKDSCSVFNVAQKGANFIDSNFKHLSTKGYIEATMFSSVFLIDFVDKKNFVKSIEVIEKNFSKQYKEIFDSRDGSVREFILVRINFYVKEIEKLSNSSKYTPIFIYNAFYLNPLVDFPNQMHEFNESPYTILSFETILYKSISYINKIK